jgi:hypothetical protein
MASMKHPCYFKALNVEANGLGKGTDEKVRGDYELIVTIPVK